VRYFLLKNTKVDAFLYKQLALIVIVAHRTGMRISEILKIRLVDVEDSAAYWVQVRESEFGGHKTASARRKIPMGALLTERELALFEDVFSIRKVLFRDSNPARVLLFSADGSATGLFDQGYVSKIVSTLMSNVYG